MSNEPSTCPKCDGALAIDPPSARGGSLPAPGGPIPSVYPARRVARCVNDHLFEWDGKTLQPIDD